MGDVVNLNKFRKKRDRKKAEDAARGNRVRYGRTSEQKNLDKDQKQRDDIALDQKKLTGRDEGENETPTEN
ncbi:DUF4169 family protein [Sneathiella chungangensis]|uniref:DUF4169 family protein n=1 Tax=Sneathiella chungangensis TaxID=1418234 RepID=A0A845MHA0_9PROT|nr:DUF4169 family protein [Sneathiella chungangensis]MZR23081.1 DUF4169 family protein [Sneathiella chungangensis]